jgi:hypothetical protein
MTKCSIIQDLLTVYVSGAVSQDSRELVDEHIASCEDCRSKLKELQNRVAMQLRDNNTANINVFKIMKKKILKRNVLVGVAASIIMAILVLFVGIRVIDYKPIAYYDGLVKVEVNYADYYYSDENIAIILPDHKEGPKKTGKTAVLDIVCARNCYSSNSTGRTITRNGELVRVEYICFLDNILSKNMAVRNEEQTVFRLLHVILINDNPVRTEVYYFTDIEAVRNSKMSDTEFDNYRHQGNLLWSGILE